MPKTGHRISKHQMKEDSFVTFAFRAQEYIQTHQKPFIIGLVVIVGVLLGAWFWSSSSQKAERQAEQEMTAAFARVQQNDMEGAAQVYQKVMAEHSGTTAARESEFYLANLYFVQKKWQDAIDTYAHWAGKYGGDNPARRAAAYAAIGDAHLQLGEYDQALEYYEKALNIKEADYLAEGILYSAAEAALLKGDTTAAKSYADRLFERNGNSPQMTNLRELLAEHGVIYTRGF